MLSERPKPFNVSAYSCRHHPPHPVPVGPCSELLVYDSPQGNSMEEGQGQKATRSLAPPKHIPLPPTGQPFVPGFPECVRGHGRKLADTVPFVSEGAWAGDPSSTHPNSGPPCDASTLFTPRAPEDTAQAAGPQCKSALSRCLFYQMPGTDRNAALT